MNPSEHVHFIGIGGYGMSAIAKVMLEMGYRVSGSDLAQHELTDKLMAKGARVFIGHEADNVQGADLVVYSTALSKDNVEMRAAAERGIPIIHRSQMLARLMNERKGVAIAGAHGKTTTSSMIALVMETCGMDPTFIIGGEIMNVGSNAKAGQGDYVVAEADESDGTFLQYHPLLAIVGNIEADHLENYNGDFENLKRAYAQFLSQVREDGKAIVCKDDVYLRDMIPAIRSEVVTYGIESDDADFVATDIRLGDRKVEFTVRRRGSAGNDMGGLIGGAGTDADGSGPAVAGEGAGASGAVPAAVGTGANGSGAGARTDGQMDDAAGGEVLGTISLSVPGKHNVYNALATLITCLEAGLTFEQVAAAITDFRGAKRRFQVIGEVDDILVIDDYAHHPTEIQATIAAAKATGKRIIAVFQPQRYTRTYYLLEQFSRAFAEADEVIITDIYSPAGERQIEGVNSAKLVELIRQNSNERVRYIPTRDEVQQFLSGHVKRGDLVLTMGAGDIWKAADGLAKQLRSKIS